ncbi:unnamed protein product [Lampetra fluviatilis]
MSAKASMLIGAVDRAAVLGAAGREVRDERPPREPSPVEPSPVEPSPARGGWTPPRGLLVATAEQAGGGHREHC